MTTTLDVVALVGSLRRASFTRLLLQGLIGVAPPTLHIEPLALGELALYNEDLEAAAPPAWVSFRARVLRAQAVLIATPEYNRSVPAVLKNALDVGSRPHGKSVWDGKPAAIISCSPGMIGGFGANHHLRQSLMYLNMPTLQQPEAYLHGIDRAIDAQGRFVSDATRQFCADFMSAFERWSQRNQKG
jgi:chromate reductase, NAD(P)H dehydrogenase (quinone)